MEIPLASAKKSISAVMYVLMANLRFEKEIDKRIASIERHLGIGKKIAAWSLITPNGFPSSRWLV